MSPTGRKARIEPTSSKISVSGFSDETNMNSSGAANTTAHSNRVMSTAVRGPRVRGLAISGIPFSGQPPLNQRHGQHQHEEDHRDGRGVGGLLLLIADP